MGNVEAPLGLREKKRRQTRDAIERAAITLVDERGYDGVTVEFICNRADISQGTFFNYFPTKDAAIVGIGVLDLDAEAVHAALDATMPATFFHAVLTLFLDTVGSYDWTSDIARMRVRLVKDTPELMRLFLNNTFEYVETFREIAGQYLAAHPELQACPDELTVQEEASIVVSQALEAAKFALYHATSTPDSSFPDAASVEAMMLRILQRP